MRSVLQERLCVYAGLCRARSFALPIVNTRRDLVVFDVNHDEPGFRVN